MNYVQWLALVPEVMRSDSLWKMAAYRYASFLGDIAWQDVSKLAQDRRTLGLSDQLYRSVGSVSANLSEGYSRGTGRDRARFYEYSLGSARESRDWYFKGRHVLGPEVGEHRMQLTSEIIRLLLTMVPDQRGTSLKEDEHPYHVTGSPANDENPSSTLLCLLNAVPLSEPS